MCVFVDVKREINILALKSMERERERTRNKKRGMWGSYYNTSYSINYIHSYLIIFAWVVYLLGFCCFEGFRGVYVGVECICCVEWGMFFVCGGWFVL